MKSYKYINHTADLGIEVRGRNLKELFINTAKAIFDTQIKGRIIPKEKINFKIEGPSIEELYVEWCRELLYNFSVWGFIPKEYKISITENTLNAELKGEKFDPKRHKIKLEVKNPTYHNLTIKKMDGFYIATITLDV